MRLNRYITEVKFDISRAVGLIQRDCGQILKHYKTYNPLYRGTGFENSPFITNNVGARLGERRPKDTPLWAHEYMNDKLTKKFGWPVRDGLSVTVKVDQARAYGNTYFFFPTNGYKWAYIIGVGDAFQYIDDHISMIDLEKFQTGPEDEWKKWNDELDAGDHAHGNFKKTKKDSPYRAAGLDAALDKVIDQYTDAPWNRANGEILFNTKKYYLVSTRYAEAISETLDIWPKVNFKLGFY